MNFVKLKPMGFLYSFLSLLGNFMEHYLLPQETDGIKKYLEKLPKVSLLEFLL